MEYTSQKIKFKMYTNGTDGDPGADGVTPRIGENGNWWIGDEDTGIKAQGIDGVSFVGVEEYYYATLATELEDGSPKPPVFSESGWKTTPQATLFGTKNNNGVDYKYLWNVEVIASKKADGATVRDPGDVSLLQIYTGGRVPVEYISYYAAGNSSSVPSGQPYLKNNRNEIEYPPIGSPWVLADNYEGSADANSYLFEITFIKYAEVDEKGENLYYMVGPTIIGKNGDDAHSLVLSNESDVASKNKNGIIIGLSEESPITIIASVTNLTSQPSIGSPVAPEGFVRDTHYKYNDNTLKIISIPNNFTEGKFRFEYNDTFKDFTLKVAQSDVDYNLEFYTTVINSSNVDNNGGSFTIRVSKTDASGAVSYLEANNTEVEIFKDDSGSALDSWTVGFEKDTITPMTFVLKDKKEENDNTGEAFEWDRQVVEFIKNGSSNGTNFILKSDQEKTGANWFEYSSQNLNDLFDQNKDRKFTLSFDLAQTSGESNKFKIMSATTSKYKLDTKIESNGNNGAYFYISENYKRYYYTFTPVLNEGSNNPTHICIWATDNSSGAKIKNVKLELGDEATSWSPAPEDLATLSVSLTNENHTFSIDSEGKIKAESFTMKVQGLKGTKQVVTEVGSISSDIPSWMSVSVVNNNSTNTTITIKATQNNITTGTEKGSLTIPITIEGKSLNKTFSWNTSRDGADGDPAPIVKITPSTLFFTSTTGKTGNFKPDLIYIYPTFSNCEYENWQYSTDGITWEDIGADTDGLKISTYNKTSNTLRISKSSKLFTDTTTTIAFRCNSKTGEYDIASIKKVYDTVDLQTGKGNLLKGTDFMYEVTKDSGILSGVKHGSFINNYNLQDLIGKTVVYSYYVNCPGERVVNSTVAETMNKRFGFHGNIRWTNSNGGVEPTTTYPFTSYLEKSVTDTRVYMVETITPPAGYDKIVSFTFQCQPYGKPAQDNDAVWKIGRPQLEIGNVPSSWDYAEEEKGTLFSFELYQTNKEKDKNKISKPLPEFYINNNKIDSLSGNSAYSIQKINWELNSWTLVSASGIIGKTDTPKGDIPEFNKDQYYRWKYTYELTYNGIVLENLELVETWDAVKEEYTEVLFAERLINDWSQIGNNTSVILPTGEGTKPLEVNKNTWYKVDEAGIPSKVKLKDSTITEPIRYTRFIKIYYNNEKSVSNPVIDNAISNLMNWCDSNNTALLDGEHIAASTVTAGVVNTNAIRSANYNAGSGLVKWEEVNGKIVDPYKNDPESLIPSEIKGSNARYSTAGTFFDLASGNIYSENFSIVNGNASFKGHVEATSGKIGGMEILAIPEQIQQANTTANNAGTLAGQAKTAADSANTIANDAAGIASQANTTANTAVGIASQANTIANDANATASGAAGTASQAKTAANTANITASSAASVASQAKTAANTAKEIAEKAIPANSSNGNFRWSVSPTDGWRMYNIIGENEQEVFKIYDSGNQNYQAVLNGTIYANNGQIGGWDIGVDSIYLSSNPKVSISGANGQIKGDNIVSYNGFSIIDTSNNVVDITPKFSTLNHSSTSVTTKYYNIIINAWIGSNSSGSTLNIAVIGDTSYPSHEFTIDYIINDAKTTSDSYGSGSFSVNSQFVQTTNYKIISEETMSGYKEINYFKIRVHGDYMDCGWSGWCNYKSATKIQTYTMKQDIISTNTSTSKVFSLAFSGSLIPSVTNTCYLGASDYTWAGLNVNNAAAASISEGSGTQTTSDLNKKNSIAPLSTNKSYSILFDNLTPVIYKYNDGSSNRYHTGFISQWVKEAMDTAGLSDSDFAALTIDNFGNPDMEQVWRLRYSEFIALNTDQIQKLKPRMSAAEQKLLDYEARIAHLEQEVAALKQ